MGLLGILLKRSKTESASRQRQRPVYKPPKYYTPEEFVIYEQEQSGECWHGVALSELSKLAQMTYRGRYVKVDHYEFLLFCYSSNSRKTKLSIQCELDKDGLLRAILHSYYPGQLRDSSNDFIEKANQ